jgi:hypothetical protein
MLIFQLLPEQLPSPLVLVVLVAQQRQQTEQTGQILSLPLLPQLVVVAARAMELRWPETLVVQAVAVVQTWVLVVLQRRLGKVTLAVQEAQLLEMQRAVEVAELVPQAVQVLLPLEALEELVQHQALLGRQ